MRVGSSSLGIGIGTSEALYGEVPLPATGHAIDLCVYVDDLAATVRLARGSGATIAVEPAEMPWGETVAYVTDPAGTLILVIENEPPTGSQ